jgi:hypothetical protein
MGKPLNLKFHKIIINLFFLQRIVSKVLSRRVRNMRNNQKITSNSINSESACSNLNATVIKIEKSDKESKYFFEILKKRFIFIIF